MCTQHTTLVVYSCSNQPQFTQHTLHVCTACSSATTEWLLTAVSMVSVGTETHVASHQEIWEGSPQLLYDQDGRVFGDICCRAPCILEGRIMPAQNLPLLYLTRSDSQTAQLSLKHSTWYAVCLKHSTWIHGSSQKYHNIMSAHHSPILL